MILNESQKKILKELTKVNSEMFFTSGTLGIASNDKTTIVYYDYGITLTKDFGISNASELLSIISLSTTPTITEMDTSLSIVDGRNKTVYKYTAQNCLTTAPDKSIFFGDGTNPGKLGVLTSVFDLTKEELLKIQQQTGTLKLPHITFENTSISATDTENTSAHTFTYDIVPSTPIAKVVIDNNNFQKIISDNYLVEIYPEAVVMKAKTYPITYVISANA